MFLRINADDRIRTADLCCDSHCPLTY